MTSTVSKIRLVGILPALISAADTGDDNTMYERDPVSLLLDRGAREMLARVYAARRGEWVMTRLADPTPRHLAWGRANGWDLFGPDNAATLSGRHINAHTRWGRAFMRALWYQHKWYGPPAGSRAHASYMASEKRAAAQAGRTAVREERRLHPTTIPLQIEWGRRLPGSARGRMLPAGRAVRIRIAYGGKTALRVVQAKRRDDRIYLNNGDQGGRFSIAADRDWA
jgi:hypothetical protein